MKLSYFSLIFPLVFMTGNCFSAEVYNNSGNKLDLYGKVDALHQLSDNSGVDGDQTYIRFGFKGETQINPSLTGYGQWEYQVSGNQAESSASTGMTRVGFAGLQTRDYGSIDYGRNYGIVYDLAAYTDVLPEFGGDAYGIDNFMFKRTSNLLTYRNNRLAEGLRVALQYQGASNDGRDALRQNGEGYGASVIKNWDSGFSAGLSFSTSNRTEGQNALAYGQGDKADVYRAGVKYDANQIYLAGTYTESYNATVFGSSSQSAYGYVNHAQIVELIAKYLFLNGLMPVVFYEQTRAQDIEGYGDQDTLKYLAVGTSYYFNKNMSTAIIYKVNLLENNKFTSASGINTDNVLAVDLVYNF